MSFEFDVVPINSRRMVVTLRGWLEPNDIGAITAAFLELCENSECSQALFDLRSFVGRPNLDAGYRIAGSLPHWARRLSVAFVDDSGWNHYADHMRRLYRELGFDAEFFQDADAGLRWLDVRDEAGASTH